MARSYRTERVRDALCAVAATGANFARMARSYD